MPDQPTTTAATVAELEHTAIDADVAALVDEPWLQTLQELIDDYNDERTTEVCRHEGGRMQADCWRHQLARTLVITRRSMYPLGSDVRSEAAHGLTESRTASFGGCFESGKPGDGMTGSDRYDAGEGSAVTALPVSP